MLAAPHGGGGGGGLFSSTFRLDVTHFLWDALGEVRESVA